MKAIINFFRNIESQIEYTDYNPINDPDVPESAQRYIY